MNTEDRLVEVKEKFGELAESLRRKDMENDNFPETVRKLLKAAFTNAFVVRRDGIFRPYFQVSYKDGLEMFTFGGVFAPIKEWRCFAKVLKNKGAVLERSRTGGYKIGKFDLTERERLLFDRAATARPSNMEEVKEIKRLKVPGGKVTPVSGTPSVPSEIYGNATLGDCNKNRVNRLSLTITMGEDRYNEQERIARLCT